MSALQTALRRTTAVMMPSGIHPVRVWCSTKAVPTGELLLNIINLFISLKIVVSDLKQYDVITIVD